MAGLIATAMTVVKAEANGAIIAPARVMREGTAQAC